MNAAAGDRDELRRLLRLYNEQPQRREEIVAQIERQFQRPAGILVLDSSGFTRTVRRHGIIHFLALIDRMDRTVRPMIVANGGRVLRAEADNIFALFGTAAEAVAAAHAIMLTLKAVNKALPAAEELAVAIGIGFGPMLVIGEDDVFGDEMNLACKLGEDVAQRGEVLLTRQAHSSLGETPWRFVEEEYSVSGIELEAFRLAWEST